MGKKKNKKTILQKISKFFVNGKPMSQVVHWAIIGGISGMMFVNIVRAGEVLEAIV